MLEIEKKNISIYNNIYKSKLQFNWLSLGKDYHNLMRKWSETIILLDYFHDFDDFYGLFDFYIIFISKTIKTQSFSCLFGFHFADNFLQLCRVKFTQVEC